MATLEQKARNRKWLIMLVIDVLIIAGLVMYFGVLHHRKADIKIDGFYLPTAVDVVPFHFTDNHAKKFTNENLKGHWSLLFFGFTNCGFVCPTTLTELNKMYLQLQKDLPENLLPQIVFISVDPERDTVKRLNSYVTAFNPHFIGVRGSEEATEKLESALHIVAAKMQSSRKGKNNYTIDHTAEILVVNPKGQLQAYLSYPHKAEQLVKDYKLIIS
jgi:protein SCO1/2